MKMREDTDHIQLLEILHFEKSKWNKHYTDRTCNKYNDCESTSDFDEK